MAQRDKLVPGVVCRSTLTNRIVEVIGTPTPRESVSVVVLKGDSYNGLSASLNQPGYTFTMIMRNMHIIANSPEEYNRKYGFEATND